MQLIETNSTRAQSDILNRVQESCGRLEVEIRRLLHEVSRMAEEALVRARKVKEKGEPAVEAERSRLDQSEKQVCALAESPGTGALWARESAKIELDVNCTTGLKSCHEAKPREPNESRS